MVLISLFKQELVFVESYCFNASTSDIEYAYVFDEFGLVVDAFLAAASIIGKI